MTSPDNRRLRGGIAGCGFFGQIQLEAWRRIAGAEIVSACDPDLERARASAPRGYRSVAEMLERESLDFLDIAARPETHLELVRAAAARRIPVICQKPMAPSWEEALAIVETAGQAAIPLMIHENWRWQPWYRVVGDRIRRGDIGEPLAYQFRSRRHDGAGAAPYPAQPYFRGMPRLLIHETLVHNIDVARFLFGDVRSVCARLLRRNPAIAGEDQAWLLLTHDVLAGWVDGHRYLDLAPDSPVLGDAVFEGDEGLLYVAPSGDVLLGGETIWKNTVTAGYRGDSVRATQEHFIDCLLNGRPFETAGREYLLKTVAVVEAAYRSARDQTLETVTTPGVSPHSPTRAG